MAHRKDFVPEADHRFNEWQDRFVLKANELAAELESSRLSLRS